MTKKNTSVLKKDYWSPIPNNPRDNNLYIDKKEKRDETKFNRDKMLFDRKEDTLARVVSKREPGEPIKTEYPKVDKKQYDNDMKVWRQRSRTAIAQDRLKKKGDTYIPKKSGRKMFEEFIRDCKNRGYIKETRDMITDEKMRNIYNAAQHLEYDDWIWFVNDEYSEGQI